MYIDINIHITVILIREIFGVTMVPELVKIAHPFFICLTARIRKQFTKYC